MIALLLLALWLPATLHCDLEAAGIESMFGCHDHAVASQPQCPDDACHSIESLTYKLDSIILKAAPPVAVFFCLPVTPPLAAPAHPSPPIIAETGQAPPEVARMWHFLTRAAPLPGAPSLIG